MDEIANELVLIFPDGRIIGSEDRDVVESHIHDSNEDNIKEYCEEMT